MKLYWRYLVMIMTLSKKDKFPISANAGDMLILEQTQDLFVFDGKKWVLIGGQYLEERTRKAIFDYFRDGWECPTILKYDLLNYLDTSEFYANIFYNRILDLAYKIVTPEFD